MSLLDKASLISTPNGFKASKLYSIVPSSGAGDLDVVRATTATRVNSAGLIESVATNVPRIDYTNGSCPSLLVEPQRTNSCLYSQEISNSVWTKDNLSLTANAITSPSGVQNADLLKETTANSQHRIYQNAVSTILGEPITFSAYAKYGGRQYIYLRVDDGSGNKIAFFDVQNGLVSTLSSGVTASIENAGNGWYRCIMSVPSVTLLATAEGIIGLANSTTFPSIYVGNTSIGVYLWGIQIETNSTYATSYIPTVASSVTRNADVISKTGISSLIGQTEGTIFIDAYRTNKSTNYQAILGLGNGTSSSEMMEFFFRASNELTIGVYNSGQQFVNTSAISSGRHKIALAYKLNDYALYIDGALIATDNSATVPTMNKLNIGGFNYASGDEYSDGINSVQLYKTRLTNTELAQLTTL